MERRSMQDRRSGKDRRKFSGLKNIFIRSSGQRNLPGRRARIERRSEWVRISRWSSVHLPSLKLSKFLKPLETDNGLSKSA
jgi:hypothetical protein